jgi:uncharacterized protein (DUF1778 family)
MEIRQSNDQPRAATSRLMTTGATSKGGPVPTAEPSIPKEGADRPTRAMQIASVRFGEHQRAIIEEEARIEGVSTSQFIRDAAYGRALSYRARRCAADQKVLEAILRFIEEVGTDTAGPVIEEALAAIEGEKPQ